jgi:dissimilatory sulfite reductase (desulfoviridin) alpha/beta subunit
MAEKIDYNDLKKGGVLQQRQPGYLIVRLRNIWGRIDADKLPKIQEIAQKYGRGYVRCTTMQGIEIPWIKYDDVSQVRKELREAGLLHGACGPRVRTIVACSGGSLCKYGLFDNEKIAHKLDDAFFGKEELKFKTKISVACCPNSCSMPRAHDIGLIGRVKVELDKSVCTGCGACAEICKPKAIEIDGGRAKLDESKCNDCGKCLHACPFNAWKEVKRGFDVYTGGKMGGEAQLGVLVLRYVPVDELVEKIERCLKVLSEHGKPGERLGALINRQGLEWYKKQLA